MAIKGNLQKKVYQDQRTGVKRRWMQYSMAYRWLKVRDKTVDWGPPLVVFFSIICAILLFAIAKINLDTDRTTVVVDLDRDKQFDNPWDMNDGRFSFTLGKTYDETNGKDNRVEAITGLGISPFKIFYFPKIL